MRKTKQSFPCGILGFVALMVCFSGCPAPRKKAQTVAQPTKKISFPWLVWSSTVSGQLRVVITTSRRLVAVEYKKTGISGVLTPVALVGLETGTGVERWRRPLALKLEKNHLPWTVNVARKDRVVTAWLQDNEVMGLDLYTGRDFWSKSRPESMGVTAVGFGFVTAWKNEIFFLKPATGSPLNTFKLPCNVTAPVKLSPEGEAVLTCSDRLVGLNLNTGKVTWQTTMDLKGGLLPGDVQIGEDKMVVGYETSAYIVKTEVSRIDSRSLKPRWKVVLPGRIRTHDAVVPFPDRVRLLFMHEEGRQVWHQLDSRTGKKLGDLPPVVRTRCIRTAKMEYCPISKGGTHGIQALDKKTLKVQWTWETVEDVSANQHFFHNGILYVGEGSKVVGLDISGTTVFRASVVIPGLDLKVNRVLGINKDVLVATAVDWDRQRGQGRLFGVNVKTGKRVWTRRLPAQLYTTDSVVLKDAKLFLADHTHVLGIRPHNGFVFDRWVHRLKGNVTEPPKLVDADKWLYAVRGEMLGLINPLNGKTLWRTSLPPATRILKVVAGMIITRTPDLRLVAFDTATGKEAWKKEWKEPSDPKFADLTGSSIPGILIAGLVSSEIADPKTGARKAKWFAARHLVTLPKNDLLLVQVLRSVPEAANVLEGLGITRRRGGAKVTRLWRKVLPRKGKNNRRGGYGWFHLSQELVLLLENESGCLLAWDTEEGKLQWKNCSLPWVAPPRRYKGNLYTATGQWTDNTSSDNQGLFVLTTGTGEAKRLIRLPRSGDPQDRYMHPSFGPIVDGMVYVLMRGPRLQAVKVAR